MDENDYVETEPEPELQEATEPSPHHKKYVKREKLKPSVPRAADVSPDDRRLPLLPKKQQFDMAFGLRGDKMRVKGPTVQNITFSEKRLVPKVQVKNMYSNR